MDYKGFIVVGNGPTGVSWLYICFGAVPTSVVICFGVWYYTTVNVLKYETNGTILGVNVPFKTPKLMVNRRNVIQRRNPSQAPIEAIRKIQEFGTSGTSDI